MKDHPSFLAVVEDEVTTATSLAAASRRCLRAGRHLPGDTKRQIHCRSRPEQRMLTDRPTVTDDRQTANQSGEVDEGLRLAHSFHLLLGVTVSEAGAAVTEEEAAVTVVTEKWSRADVECRRGSVACICFSYGVHPCLNKSVTNCETKRDQKQKTTPPTS